MSEVNRDHLKKLMAIEEDRFLKLHPKSGILFKQAQGVMTNGVPMSWMSKWPGAYPVFVDTAQGAYFTERDRWFRESVTDAVKLHSERLILSETVALSETRL